MKYKIELHERVEKKEYRDGEIVIKKMIECVKKYSW